MRSLISTSFVLLLVSASSTALALRASGEGSSIYGKAAALKAANSQQDWISAMQDLLDTANPAKLEKVNKYRDPKQPTTVPADMTSPPKPTELCGACRKVGDVVFDALLHNHNATFKLVEWAANVACAEFTKTEKGAEICQDVVDLVLYGLHKADLEVQGRLKFNMSIIFCTDVLHLCKVPCCVTETQPEQIHIGFPTNGDAVAEGKMQVTWSIYTKPTMPMVKFGKVGSALVDVAPDDVSITTYTVSGWVGWLVSGTMSNLTADTEYQYQVGDLASGVWSDVLNFTTLPTNIGTPERPLHVASFADMGTGGTHWETINGVKAKIDAGEVDLIVHGGDISYADGDQYRWDRFLREMQPLVSRIPYMCIPGNHELLYNFTAYRTRFFAQPRAQFGGPNDAMFYTWTIGPNIRFVLMDSESPIDTPEINSIQTAWASKVLSTASQQRQFIFLAFHRPLYCTSTMGSCFKEQAYLQHQVEQILVENNVAIVHTGHVHNYERSYPVIKGVRQSTSYENTTAPVSFVNGAPGCEEGLSAFGNYHGKPRPDYSAVRIEKTSFQYSQIYSEPAGSMIKHTANITQYRSKDGSVLDSLVLTKYL